MMCVMMMMMRKIQNGDKKWAYGVTPEKSQKNKILKGKYYEKKRKLRNALFIGRQ